MSRQRASRGAWLLALAMACSACASPLAPKPAATPGSCSRLSLPAGSRDKPVALLRDVGGPTSEALAGWPLAATLQLLPTIASYVGPVPFGHGVVFTKLVKNQPEIWGARAGGCLAKLSDGNLETADPGGRAYIAVVSSQHRMFDSSGRYIATIPPGFFTWTYDGTLASGDPSQGTMTAYDLAGHQLRHFKVPNTSMVGALGPSSVLADTATHLMAYDLKSGHVRDLDLPPVYVASGSPDGQYVALDDQVSGPQLVRLSDKSSSPLPRSGPVFGFSWSADSHWVGVSSPYGGGLFETGGGGTDLGSLVVTGWL